jgi:ribonuclease HI
MLTCRLEFQCTNNTAEYEALIQGLKKEINMNVQDILVFSDSKIIVKQVKNQMHCISSHLKHYQQLAQDLSSKFSAFNIVSISRMQNASENLLENVASRLIPPKYFSPDRFSVELIFRPYVPDNITNW